MIHLVMRHLALRIWLALLMGMPAAFALVAFFPFSPAHTLRPALIYTLVMGVSLFLSGALLHFIGHWWISRTLKTCRRLKEKGDTLRESSCLLLAQARYRCGLVPPWRTTRIQQQIFGSSCFPDKKEVDSPG